MKTLNQHLRHLAFALAFALTTCFATSASAEAEIAPGFSAEAEVPASGPFVVPQKVANTTAIKAEADKSVAEVPANTHASEAKHEEAHSGPLTWAKIKDFIYRTINFAALLVILVHFFGKPVVNGLSGRQKRIADELETLTAKRDAAEASYREFTSKIAGMEKDMERVVSQAVAQAQSEKARILAEAERAAEEIKRQAQSAVQGEIELAKQQLRIEVAEEAAKMAEELIKKNLTEADQVSITEQYLERVGAAL